ncbi:hypothetical protein [Mesorhizobium cantuariense]|uniref:SARP family transcriptional regulator n=1 Tax=Mesorhizobium cantuariense TaxID=1300275 RepID=A0ABV7MS17_9HYPH
MSHETANIFLLGPFQIVGPGGEDITPVGQKAKALLALVAVADRAQRSRTWLCGKLWSDRAPEQAFASLRQTLTEIRKALGVAGKSILKIDASTVALDLTAVRIDTREFRNSPARMPLVAQSSAEFLEGIDVRDSEFEEWLSIERSHWEGFHGAHTETRKATSAEYWSTPALQPGYGATLTLQLFTPTVDLLSPVIDSHAGDARFLASEILELLSQSIAETAHVSLLDRRDTTPAATPSGQRSPLALQVIVTGGDRDFAIIVKLLNRSSSCVEFQTTIPVATSVSRVRGDAMVLAKVNLTVDMLLKCLQRMSARAQADPAEAARIMIFSAVDDLFGITGDRLVRAEASLRQAMALAPMAQTYAWLAYLSTFKLGQKTVVFSVSDIDEAEALARRALELEPNNALTLALCAHVFSFILHNHDYATDLYVRSLTLNPHRPLTWDLFSVLHSYLGQPEVGFKCARWAATIGAFSPYSYFFDTSCCMNASLSGNHFDAVEFGTRALNARPNFSPALRYLIPSLGHLRAREGASMRLQCLLRAEPDFSTENFLQGQHLQLKKEQLDLLRRGFSLAGAPER